MALFSGNDEGGTPLVQLVLKTGFVSERKHAEKILMALAALCFLAIAWILWPEARLPDDVQENPNYEPATR